MSYLGNEPPQIAGYSTQTKAAPVGSSITLNQEGTVNSILLFLDGVRQTPTTDYTVSGTTLTLTSTAPTTAVATILFLGDVADIGVPSDDTVNVGQLDTTSTGTTGQFLKKTGAGAIDWATVAAAGGFIEYTVVTASNSAFELEANTTKVVIEIQSSGGTAGSQDSHGYQGGGGGGGAYARKLLTGMTGATDQLDITIGSVAGIGATGNTTSVAAAGTASFTTISCDGGDGGVSASGSSSNGGVGGDLPTTGDFNIAGGDGAGGFLAGAPGGGSFLGVGAIRNGTTSGVGPTPRGYGSGGSGGYGTGSHAGGAGGPAAVIVWEFA